MAMLDIFDQDAFSVHELTLAINALPYTPGRIGQMNVFTNKPISTNVAIVEHKLGTLQLLPTMPRGSEGQTTLPRDRRKVRAFPVPHIPVWDSVLAADVEGKRAFGSEDQLEVYSTVVNDVLQKMKDSLELTREFHRIGCLHGKVLDSDGATVLYNWFDEFGINETTININVWDSGVFDEADPAGNFKTMAIQVKRAIQDALGATPFTGITAICGDNFFDALVNHATVRRAFEQWQNNSFARTVQIADGSTNTGFEFAGIWWENYRGSVGSVDFVNTNQARFFPTGTRDVFIESPAPADFIETVNTRGMMEYAKQERLKWDKGIELHAQSNVLYMCSRPACLIKGTMTNVDPGA